MPRLSFAKKLLISSHLKPLFFETAFIDGKLDSSCDLGFLVQKVPCDGYAV